MRRGVAEESAMLVGATELALILVIVMIFFGAGKLPDVMTALGKGVKQFRDAQREGDEAAKKEIDALRSQLSMEPRATVEADRVREDERA
jgi:sec-independent protein translocase protein TatA